MALIRCPECGKENVSDRAVACPTCGYPIKEQFDRIKAKEGRIEKQEKEKEEIINIDDELDKRKKAIDNLERKVNGYKISMVVCGILGIVLILEQFLVGPSTELSFVALVEFGLMYYMKILLDRAKDDLLSETILLDLYEKNKKFQEIADSLKKGY